MLLENFVAGTWEKRDNYKSFEPKLINHGWTWNHSRINVLLERATRALASFDATINNINAEEVERYIRMHVLKEADASSRIEGTQTDIEDLLQPKESIDPEKRGDWQEVQNYVRALNEAVADTSLPLSNRLIRQAHKTLMSNVRGGISSKRPGDFRTSQNWIGNSLKDATFIPPHHSYVDDYMSDLEKFLHNNTLEVPHLIKIAIVHYQFETIHPFLDGNGRIGRLIIPLYLIENKILSKPAFYLSDYFEKNRLAYYDALTHVRTKNDMISWIVFFLTGVEQVATKGITTFRKILDLKKATEEKIREKFNTQAIGTLLNVINLFYNDPSITVKAIANQLHITYPTANSAVKDLVDQGILLEITQQARNRAFYYKNYLRLFQE
ncbi:MAG: Fic family protein [Alphaproteobacteria bacterium]|nr:Fic family protein [Alphaproteobacteria bacterium]